MIVQMVESNKHVRDLKNTISRENKIEFAYDYENLNASYVNEKINFEDDYFQEIINPDFEKIDSPFQQTSSFKPYVPNVILEKIIIDLEDEVVNLLEKEKVNLETIESLKSKGFESSENVSSESENQSENDCLVVEKECDKEENPKVIAPGIFKLNVSQYVSPISMSKSSCDSKNVEIKLKRKRRKRKSSKQNVKQVDNDVSRANNDFVHFSDLGTFSSVRRPRHRNVIWKKKGSSNTSNVDLSAVSVSNLNKNIKRYSRKDFLACNNSNLGETRSDFVCNDAMNVSCDSRMNDFLDDNNFFIFDDVNVRISPVSKMPFRKKPRDSMHVRSKINTNKSLPRTVHKWLPKLQSLAEPVAKWFPRIIQICLWIIDSGCSKQMTGNRAPLTNFMEKFLGTIRFDNNDFAVIAGYGDVVIDGVDLLTGDRSLNLYSIDLNEVALNSLTCLLAKASSLQSWLWHQRLSHLSFATINNLVKNNLVQVRFGNNDFAVIAGYGDVVIGSMTIKKVYYVEGLGHNLFSVGQFCDKGLERIRTDNGTKFKNKTLAKFFDEVGITQQFSASRTPQKNGVMERRNLTLVGAARTMLSFANLPSFLWAEAIATACFTQNHSIIHKRLPKMKFKKDHLCSACEQGKIHWKHHKSKTAFASNKPLYLLHMDLCGPMCVQSINGKRYVLVVVDDYSRYTWVFFLHSKDEASEVIISFIKKTKLNLQLQVQHVRTDNGKEFKNKTLAKFFDEIHESVNANFDEISKMASKQFSLEPGLSNLNETGKSLNLSVSNVDEASKKDLEDLFQDFYEEYFDSLMVMKSLTTNVETLIIEEVFHEVSESFQGESSPSSLNDDVQQSPEEVILPSSNTTWLKL
nr:hypothetical protein [Tanacetum cinerariifolium]